MEDFSFEAVAKKSVRGILALVSRTLLIQILGIVSYFILGIYLDSSYFGVFIIVSAIVVFFTYFQDIGLAAALIQKKEEPTIGELRSTFTLQQILVLVLVIPALIFSSQIASIYKLDSSGHLLLIALLISFFLSSLRTIPTVLLERHLNFNKLVVPQIAENIVYYMCLIIFAIAGFGVATFTIAILARSILGLIATYYIQRWPIGLSIKFGQIRHLINFGIPFQANSLLALLKDDLLIIYVGTILPLAQVGYIGFSQKWAFMPLRFIMDNVIKITFPSYSRLRHDKGGLKLAIEKSLFLVSFFIFPIAAAIILYSPFLIEFIPEYRKWEPVLLSLAFFAASTGFSSISTPLTNLFNAIGKVKITLYFMVFWTVLTWILTPLLIGIYGYDGFAIASFIISITSIGVFIAARKYVEFSFVKPVARQFLATLVMGGAIWLTSGIITSFPMLFLNMIMGGAVYMGVLILFGRGELVKTFKFIMISVRSKS